MLERIKDRTLVKQFTVPYALWIEFKDKCRQKNLNNSDAIVLLIRLFVSGKLDLLL